MIYFILFLQKMRFSSLLLKVLLSILCVEHVHSAEVVATKHEKDVEAESESKPEPIGRAQQKTKPETTAKFEINLSLKQQEKTKISRK